MTKETKTTRKYLCFHTHSLYINKTNIHKYEQSARVCVWAWIFHLAIFSYFEAKDVSSDFTMSKWLCTRLHESARLKGVRGRGGSKRETIYRSRKEIDRNENSLCKCVPIKWTREREKSETKNVYVIALAAEKLFSVFQFSSAYVQNVWLIVSLSLLLPFLTWLGPGIKWIWNIRKHIHTNTNTKNEFE